MAKKINPAFREAYRSVFAQAAANATFRGELLGGKKKDAIDAMTKFLNDPALAAEIADSIYSGASTFRKLKPDAKSLIKFMSYVFGDLPLPVPTTTRSLSRGTAGDCFDDIEDWENCW
jgi:hypothetical protein